MEKLLELIKKNYHRATIVEQLKFLRANAVLTKREFTLLMAVYNR